MLCVYYAELYPRRTMDDRGARFKISVESRILISPKDQREEEE
jgi:hypothetical protein